MKKGFTLIELLVVIAIMAVLAGVSVSVFSTAQKSARDSRRKQEISVIAKALEASKNFSSGRYKYNPTIFANDFPAVNGQPTDSLYCYWDKKYDATNPTIPPPGPTSAYTTSTCGSCIGEGTCTSAKQISSSAASAGDGFSRSYNIDWDDGNVSSWTICANLENDVPFCRSSMSR